MTSSLDAHEVSTNLNQHLRWVNRDAFLGLPALLNSVLCAGFCGMSERMDETLGWRYAQSAFGRSLFGWQEIL